MQTTPHSKVSLYLAMELSNKNWKLAFSNGARIRKVNVPAGHQEAMREAVRRSREHFGLPADTPVRCCYEAGRDGFWIHRFLSREGIENLVVDPASIEVNRRFRRVKTDRLDAEKLLRMLMRHWAGERTVWKVVHVPSEEQEDDRRLHRELERLQKERTAHLSRTQSLLVMHGIRFRGQLSEPRLRRLRTWSGNPLPPGLHVELRDELQRTALLKDQIRALEKERSRRVKESATPSDAKVAKLLQLRGIGPVSSWLLVKEFFAWRNFRNRREVGASAGLTGSPYASGEESRDLGISKAGNRRVRWIMIEIAWKWLMFQPQSELSLWFWKRFGYGSKRMRRVGIVALARKLLIALWKYIEQDELPAGAVLSPRRNTA